MPDQTSVQEAKTRLRRIEGQVRGIQGMLDRFAEGDAEACEALLTQLLAARAALENVGLLILDLHLQSCVFADLPRDEQRLQDLREALKLWTRLSPPPQREPSPSPKAPA
jgi:DNA-binding FrmR family transcriptional regulator